MKISIEWFLLDNTTMNVCIFLLASVLSGIPMKWRALLLFSLGGAVYALLATFYLPLLQTVWLKLVAFGLLAIPMHEKGTPILITLACVLISAAMIGGAVLLITLLTGGTIRAEGTVIGTIPLRSSLIGLAVSLMIPRLVRLIIRQQRMKSLHTKILVRLQGTDKEFDALIDSGNLLIEPLSGLPVVLLNDPGIPKDRPIVYQTQGGTGVLYGAHPERVVLNDYRNCSVDCFVASAMQPIRDADAILPELLLPKEWRNKNEKMG